MDFFPASSTVIVCPISKKRVISPKNGITANTNLVGSQANRDAIYTDRFVAVGAAPVKQQAQKGYRRLPTSSHKKLQWFEFFYSKTSYL